MASILNIATTGLLASQQSMSTIGHNIANVNTPGYSRQRTELGTLTPQFSGGVSFGSGVGVNNVSRVFDVYTMTQLNNATSLYNKLETYFNSSIQVENSISQAGTNIASGLQSFFNALQNVNETPDYPPTRSTFLNESQSLIARFHNLANQLSDQQTAVNQQVSAIITQVNTIANTIKDLNGKIAGSANPSPDLLDTRDQAINELSKLVTVSTLQQQDGSVSVSIGNGQTLVVGSTSTQLVARRNTTNPEIMEIDMLSNGLNIDISSSLSGGTLGGVLDFQTEILQPAQRGLNIIALGLTTTFNQQQNLGMDLDGNLGQNFFTDINSTLQQQSRVLINQANSGTAVLSANITDVNQLASSDYTLTVSIGPSYTLTRNSDNTSVTFAGFPYSYDGFTLNLDSGATSAGDTFIVEPARNAAVQIDLNNVQINDIAVGAPIMSSHPTSNQGDGVITPGVVTDTTNAAFTTTAGQLTPPVRVEFLSATSYQLVNVTTSGVIEGPIVYNPAISNSVFPTPGAYDPGYRVEISGAPATGDTFTVDYNTGGVADNRNGLLLGQLQNTSTLTNGTNSYSQFYSNLIADIGSRTNQASVNRDSSEIILQQAQSRRDSVSGVNLDEEAADLLRYQQAYQAAAKLVQISASIIDTLIQSVSR